MSTELLAQALRELIIMSKAEWGRYPVNTNGKLAIIKAETALAAHEALPVEPRLYLYQHDETWRTTIREPGDRMTARRWQEIPLYAHQAPQPQRCPYCDDTGDVHSADGEWRGVCTCSAGAAPQPQQAAPEQTAKMVPAGVAFSDLFMEQFEALAGSVTSDIIKDAARLAAACAYSLAATPPQPTAPAPQPEPLHLGACITDGKLHATVMRREANGYIAVVAAAEIDEALLRAGDCHALMTAPAPLAQAVSQDVIAALQRVELKFGRFDDGSPKDWQEWVDFREALAVLASAAQKEPA